VQLGEREAHRTRVPALAGLLWMRQDSIVPGDRSACNGTCSAHLADHGPVASLNIQDECRSAEKTTERAAAETLRAGNTEVS
jgi:hypothetical protein